PERRPAAADRERDAALVEPRHGRDGARGQPLVGRDEGTVDIRDDERDRLHCGHQGVSTSTPRVVATTTAELPRTKSPLSTTPTIAARRRWSPAGALIGPNRQSRMKLPPSLTKGCSPTA